MAAILTQLGAPVRRKPMPPPVVNWSDPISRDLILCIPFWEGFDYPASPSQIYRDAVGLVDGQLTGIAGNTLIWKDRATTGPRVIPDVGSNHRATASFSKDPLGDAFGPHAIMVRMRADAAVASSDYFFMLGITGSEYRINLAASGTQLQCSQSSGGANETANWVMLFGEDLVIIANRAPGIGSEYFVNGRLMTSVADTLLPGAVPYADLTINARKTPPSSYARRAEAEFDLIAMWRRTLGRTEIQRLTADSWAMLRSDDPPELQYYPIHRRMTDPGLPVRRVLLKPIDQTDADAGVIMAAKANRIDGLRAEIRVANLNDEEWQMVLNCWDDGRGQVQPFWMKLPGENDRLWIFEARDLRFIHETGARRGGTIRLIDVTRHGNP